MLSSLDNAQKVVRHLLNLEMTTVLSHDAFHHRGCPGNLLVTSQLYSGDRKKKGRFVQKRKKKKQKKNKKKLNMTAELDNLFKEIIETEKKVQERKDLLESGEQKHANLLDIATHLLSPTLAPNVTTLWKCWSRPCFRLDEMTTPLVPPACHPPHCWSSHKSDVIYLTPW